MPEPNEIYGWVKDLPVVDWHNHLDPRVLAEDRPLGSLYDVWVRPDPYKHRVLRICGVPERLITGDAPAEEKMSAWRATLPRLVGNPLFAWARMEQDFLAAHPLETLTPRAVLRLFNVAYASPCVPVDGDLSLFASAAPDDVRVVPSLRLNFGDDVPQERLEAFHAAGCRVVDVSVDAPADLPSAPDARTRALFAFAAAHGWTLLLHLGALRATSTRLRTVAGPAGGFAGMAAPCDPRAVAGFLNGLEASGALPRTVLMTLNPEAHAQLAVLAGSFVADDVPGKVQLGPAWWWCDHREGIFDVFEKVAAYGVLSTFVGMTTDSRSLLSFVRHDYFRRLFARWMAKKVADGDFPDDASLLRPLAEDVCCGNAARMVGLENG